MCWSAEADLVAGTVVGGLGVWCLARVRRARDVPLAALPLVLGVHQLIEAAVWSGAGGGGAAGHGESADRVVSAGWAPVAWAVIALPLLPALVSLGVWCSAGPAGLGTAAQRWRAVVALVGVTVSGCLAVVVASHPITAEAHGHTLRYAIGAAGPAGILQVGYLIATVGALLLGGDRLLRLLGVLVGLGAVLCLALYRLAFVSTWCALSALAALVLLRWVRRPLPGPGGTVRPAGS
ncbi:DUF6629 family protein [Kitasatospora viridis]|uniref:Uncharacterized protein n=1 Tax=Kitasatospora viridis TaxID=281105 RepID=A0A561TSM4_9ACTN|nr:DUF6629 family protein [Kitasatospora viridis]TWF90125.1 hypothetical protein FHX73_13169 [Kitasatospora viridis]